MMVCYDHTCRLSCMRCMGMCICPCVFTFHVQFDFCMLAIISLLLDLQFIVKSSDTPVFTTKLATNLSH